MDLVISHVYKDFGRGPVLRDVSLTVRQGSLRLRKINPAESDCGNYRGL